MPNIVAAVTTERGRHDAHAIAELTRGRELQRKAVRFARTLPETLAMPPVITACSSCRTLQSDAPRPRAAHAPPEAEAVVLAAVLGAGEAPDRA